MTSKAQSLGLLSIHSAVHKNGSKSCNVYVFNRFEPSNKHQLNHAKTSNSQTIQHKDKTIRTEDPYSNTHIKVVSSFVLKDFSDYANHFFPVELIE